MLSTSDAFRYLAAPRFVMTRTKIDAAALHHLTSLLFLTLFLGVLTSAIFGSLIVAVMGEVPANVNGTLAETNVRQLIVYGVLFAPILEEIIFRSWLGFPRSSVLGFPALLCVLVLLAALGLQEGGAILLPMVAGLGCLFIILLRQFRRLTEAEQAVARTRLFPVAFWGAILTFGIIHLTNYEGGLSGALTTPILFLAVVPQIIAGAMLGYVRMRFGLIAAIIFHMIYNAVLITIAVSAASQMSAGG